MKVYNSGTGDLIGEITDEQFEFLVDQLEEENEEDENYYIDLSTLDYLEENGADEDLLALLQKALGEEEGIEIRINEGTSAGS